MSENGGSISVGMIATVLGIAATIFGVVGGLIAKASREGLQRREENEKTMWKRIDENQKNIRELEHQIVALRTRIESGPTNTIINGKFEKMENKVENHLNKQTDQMGNLFKELIAVLASMRSSK